MRDSTSILHDTVFVGKPWNGISGNYDTSRLPIDRIIIHTMEGTLAGTTSWFQNPTVKQSAHYGIGLNGHIRSFIPETATAYHSGAYQMNQRSLGLEFEDGYNPATNPNAVNLPRPDALYKAAAALVADIAKTYNIPLDRQHVLRHNEVVGRTCPGSLDVDKILSMAKEILNVQPDEALVSHMLKPSVFTNLVTKSSEYDELWASLGLDLALKGRKDSHKLVLTLLDTKVSEARSGFIKEPELPLEPPQTPVSPSEQPKSVLSMDVKDMFSVILSLLKRRKSNG